MTDWDLDRVRYSCLHGQCGPFAAFLAARTGWPIGSVQGLVGDPDTGIHAVVYHPDGGVVDADGRHDENTYANTYAHAVGLTGDWWIVPLDDTDPAYGYAPVGLAGFDFPPAAITALVFKVLDDIGYNHSANDETLTRQLSPVAELMLASYLSRHMEPS